MGSAVSPACSQPAAGVQRSMRGQPLYHGFPGLGGTAELRQVGIAALHVARVHASAGAQQFQREILRRVLEGDDDHRHVLGRCRGELQRQGRFAHARRARKQVQSFGEAAQEVIKLREASRHTQHRAAGRLPLQAARFCVRQDLGQYGAGPLQPACSRVTQRCLDAESLLFQQSDDVRRGRGFIEERLRRIAGIGTVRVVGAAGAIAAHLLDDHRPR